MSVFAASVLGDEIRMLSDSGSELYLTVQRPQVMDWLCEPPRPEAKVQVG